MHGNASDQAGASGRGHRIERLGCARLFDPAPRSPGAGAARQWAAAGSVTRACFTTILLIVSLPAPARGQPEAGASREIPVHPRITTVLNMPDDIELARFTGQTTGMMRATQHRELLSIRPRAGLRAGTEVVLYVQTATVRRRFRLRVVGRARDAWRRVVVLAPDAEPEPAPPPASPEPAAKPDQSITAPAPMVIRSPPFEISVHLVGSLGFTGLHVAGYQPSIARQLHAGLGGRLVVTRPDAWWALEANIIAEWRGGAMSFAASDARDEVAINGPWLRMEVGTRVLLGGTRWNPSFYAGLGVQAHLRQTEDTRRDFVFSETMPRGAVLALGIGLQRRAGNLLLGLDFQVREGWPDGYHSAAVLWTVGSHLDPE